MTEAERIAALLGKATPEAAAQLREIAETTTEKDTRKEARRALYRLSQSGIVPTERAPQTAPAPRPEEPDTLRAYASAFDGAGNRLLTFIAPDKDGGSPILFQILCSDEQGVRDYDTKRMSRRELTEHIAQLEGQMNEGIVVAEVEADYARWLLAQARETNRRLHKMTPPGFLDLLPLVGEPRQRYDAPPLYAHIAPEAARADNSIPHDPADLFALPWFAPWFFDADDAYPWLVKYAEAGQSQIELPENVRKERSEKVFADTAEALMSPETRAHYIRRLEESADVLWRRGEEQAARMALYHAQKLAEDNPVSQIPFATLLAARSIAAAYQMMREEAGETANPEPSGSSAE